MQAGEAVHNRCIILYFYDEQKLHSCQVLITAEDCITDCLHSVIYLRTASVIYVCSVDTSNPMTYFDTHRLHQLTSRYISNAISWMPWESKISRCNDHPQILLPSSPFLSLASCASPKPQSKQPDMTLGCERWF